MDQQARESAFIAALTTEHFVLQSARSSLVSEQVGRAVGYFSAVSSSLIALGFLDQMGTRIDLVVAAVLPALFILAGWDVGRVVRGRVPVKPKRRWLRRGEDRRRHELSGTRHGGMTRRGADNEGGAYGRNGDRDAVAPAAGVVDHGWRQAPVGDLLGGHGRF